MKQTYYQILGVAVDADPATIKKVYRELARRYHPDHNPTDDEALEQFRRVSEAYATLNNTESRRRYDAWLLRQDETPEPWQEAIKQRQAAVPATAHRLPIQALFAAFGFVCLSMIIMTITLVSFTPDPQSTTEQTRQAESSTDSANQAATVQAGQSLPVPSGVNYARRTLDANQMRTPAADPPPLTCTIDLVNATQTCDDIPQIALYAGPEDGRVALRLRLNPQESQYTRVLFAITYGDQADGWTVNIGDSISNDGNGGDAGDRVNNAEVQINDGVLRIYGSDAAPNSLTPLLIERDFAQPYQTVYLVVGHQTVQWQAGDTAASEIESRYLFALRGELDRDMWDNPVPNYNIYVAFNRVIHTLSTRRGQGVEQVTITLIGD